MNPDRLIHGADFAAPAFDKPDTGRRRVLLTAGAGIALGSFAHAPFALAAAPIRQGFQTNIWGMSTYYLLHSGLLKKHGIEHEEFAVPSGNLTMQQQVARQVDLGTYAGPSFVIGNAKGGLVAIAVIEQVGRSVSIMARKDLNITKVEQLKGRKIANQTGSSIGNIFMDQIAPKAGLKKGDFEEVRMNVNDMVAAMAAKTVDAMVNVEPYNEIAISDGLASTVMNYWDVDKMPVLMASTPEFVKERPDTVVAYLKAWLEVAKDFKNEPGKVADVIYAFYTSKGYKMSRDTFQKALAKIDVEPDFPKDLAPYLKTQAEILLKARKIRDEPDWKTALRPDFLEKARKG